MIRAREPESHPMPPSHFRYQALHAGGFPVLLFLIFPMMVTAPGESRLMAMFSWLILLFPMVLVGDLLAPWAGRQVAQRKGPAFILCASAALAPMLVPVTAAAWDGRWILIPGIAGLWACFALPASVLSALLFIGGCERTPPE